MQKRFSFLKRINLLNIFTTFILVNIAWIFFRASTFNDATHIITQLFSKNTDGQYFSLGRVYPAGDIKYLGITGHKFIAASLLIPLLFLCDWLIGKGFVMNFDRWPLPVKWAVYYTIIIAILLFGIFETNQFIYFQF